MACKSETGPILVLDAVFGLVCAQNNKSSIIMLISLSEIHSVCRSLENSVVVVEDPNTRLGISQPVDDSSIIAFFIDTTPSSPCLAL